LLTLEGSVVALHRGDGLFAPREIAGNLNLKLLATKLAASGRANGAREILARE